MSECATNACFRNGSPSPLGLGALATALSAGTTVEKAGMFAVPRDKGETAPALQLDGRVLGNELWGGWAAQPRSWWQPAYCLPTACLLPAPACPLVGNRSPCRRWPLLRPCYLSSPQHPFLPSIVFFIYGRVRTVIVRRKRV